MVYNYDTLLNRFGGAEISPDERIIETECPECGAGALRLFDKSDNPNVHCFSCGLHANKFTDINGDIKAILSEYKLMCKNNLIDQVNKSYGNAFDYLKSRTVKFNSADILTMINMSNVGAPNSEINDWLISQFNSLLYKITTEYFDGIAPTEEMVKENIAWQNINTHNNFVKFFMIKDMIKLFNKISYLGDKSIAEFYTSTNTDSVISVKYIICGRGNGYRIFKPIAGEQSGISFYGNVKSDNCILVEGAFDAISLCLLSLNNGKTPPCIISLGGTSVHNKDIEMLQNKYNKITLWYDNDDKGQGAKLIDKISNIMTIYTTTSTAVKDIDDFINLNKNNNDVIYNDVTILLSSARKVVGAPNLDIIAPINKAGNRTINKEEIAKYIVDKYELVLSNGELYMYVNNLYEPVNDTKKKRDLSELLINTIGGLSNLKLKAEMYDFIYSEIKKTPEKQNVNFNNHIKKYIPFRDFLYNVDTGDRVAYSPNVFVTNTFNFDCPVTRIPTPKIDKLLYDWVGPKKEDVDLMKEILGSIYRVTTPEIEKGLFVLIGDGGNGKTAFTDLLIKRILGEPNYSTIKADKFNTRSIWQIENKYVNIGSEVTERDAINVNIFLNITSGEEIESDRKFQHEKPFTPFCKLIFATNNFPNFLEKNKAIDDRVLIIPFDNVYRGKKTSKTIDELFADIKDEIPSFILDCNDAVKKVLMNKNFTLTKKITDCAHLYKSSTDNVYLFFTENFRITESQHIKTSALYAGYLAYCKDNNLTATDSRKFRKAILSKFPELSIKLYNTGEYYLGAQFKLSEDNEYIFAHMGLKYNKNTPNPEKLIYNTFCPKDYNGRFVNDFRNNIYE